MSAHSPWNEERLAELLALLKPPPVGWVEAAAQLPALRAALDDLVARAERDAAFRAALVAVLTARATEVDPRTEARDFHLGRTLARAADAPLAIGETACDVALLAAQVADRGDEELRPEAATAALLAQAAARVAAHLVEINLASAPDDDRGRRVLDLVRTAAAAAKRAANEV